MEQKSLQQQLQSRMDRRQNLIARMEEMRSTAKYMGFVSSKKSYERQIKELAVDQKLDRKLYQLTLVRERVKRLYNAFARCE